MIYNLKFNDYCWPYRLIKKALCIKDTLLEQCANSSLTVCEFSVSLNKYIEILFYNCLKSQRKYYLNDVNISALNECIDFLTLSKNYKHFIYCDMFFVS